MAEDLDIDITETIKGINAALMNCRRTETLSH